MAALLEHDRYCTEILEQTRLFGQAIASTDQGTTVPTCPEWTLRDLVAHLGVAHRWAAELVRRRADSFLPTEEVPDTDPPQDASSQELAAWLSAGAEHLVEQLRTVAPDTPVWNWMPTAQRADCWGRRMAHETAIHRVDAVRAGGGEFTMATDLAADCLNEWLELITLSEVAEYQPEAAQAIRERAGSSLHLHGTDGEPGVAEWLIEIGPEGASWRHAHSKATVALRGPVVDVLLVMYGRLSPSSEGVTVLGEAELLDHWLKWVRF